MTITRRQLFQSALVCAPALIMAGSRTALAEVADGDGTTGANVRVFDTVEAMQAATDLADGAVCLTDGFHAAGDGGHALYSVSAAGDTTTNEYDALAVSGSLVANLVTDGRVSVRQLGAYGDATWALSSSQGHDDSAVFQHAVDTYEAVYVPAGTYAVHDVKVSKSVSIEGAATSYSAQYTDEFALLRIPKAAADADASCCVFDCTGSGGNTGGLHFVLRYVGMQGMDVNEFQDVTRTGTPPDRTMPYAYDLTYETCGIKTDAAVTMTLDHCMFQKFHVGFYMGYYGTCNDCAVTRCRTGIICNCADSAFGDDRVSCCEVGIELQSGSNGTTMHDVRIEEINDTGILVSSNSNIFRNISFDQLGGSAFVLQTANNKLREISVASWGKYWWGHDAFDTDEGEENFGRFAAIYGENGLNLLSATGITADPIQTRYNDNISSSDGNRNLVCYAPSDKQCYSFSVEQNYYASYAYGHRDKCWLAVSGENVTWKGSPYSILVYYTGTTIGQYRMQLGSHDVKGSAPLVIDGKLYPSENGNPRNCRVLCDLSKPQIELTFMVKLDSGCDARSVVVKRPVMAYTPHIDIPMKLVSTSDWSTSYDVIYDKTGNIRSQLRPIPSGEYVCGCSYANPYSSTVIKQFFVS